MTHHTLLALALLLGASLTGCGQRRVDTRAGMRAPAVKSSAAATVEVAHDSVANPAFITIAGYDKPLRATRETMRITNTDTALTLLGLRVRIDYRDLSGRELHSREADLAFDDVPPGATRLAETRSWDAQHTFYYHRGPAPRNTAGTTPYAVTVTPLMAYVNPADTPAVDNNMEDYQLLNPQDFKTAMADPAVKLIDVRTPAEYAGGHLPGATLVTWDPSDPQAFVRAVRSVVADGQRLLLYCRSGKRSGDASEALHRAGLTRITDLAGGITAWQSADLPLAR